MISQDTAYFALAFLLLLSIATISLCKRDGPPPESYAEFLFRGKTFIFSLVSSAGSAFSVTYFLGATFIYASILRAWTVPILGALAALTIFAIRRVIIVAAQDNAEAGAPTMNQNLLLTFMQRRLTQRNFRVFIQLLFGTFFLLLVEELSISRVVLDSLIPGMEPLTAALLFIIVIVIFAYLYIGGFRAVLTSDWVQSTVLIAFIALLLYLAAGNRDALTALAAPSGIAPITIVGALVLWTLYGTAFLIMAVDLFSRLNFEVPVGRAIAMRLQFITISIMLVFVIVFLGIVFAIAMSPQIGHVLTPSQYYLSITRLFAATPLYHVAFLVAVFCMIFTTVNTLLVTVAQIGFYRGGFGSRRSDLSRLVVLATFLSVVVDADAVCAFGIFVGSLLLLPLTQLLKELASSRTTDQGDDRYLWLALALSIAGFIAIYPFVSLDFEFHFLIPGLVFGAVLVALTLWRGAEYIRRSVI